MPLRSPANMRALAALLVITSLTSVACDSAHQPLQVPPPAPRAVSGGEELVLAGRACDTSADCSWWQDPDPQIVCCGGQCLNLHRDPRNCGACGVQCPAGQVCAEGACREAGPTCGSARCPAGELCCGGSCFLPIGTDCGGCGISCSAAGAGCVNGRCCAFAPVKDTSPLCDESNACPDWQARCDDVCRDITIDPSNCGGCARACPADLPRCVAGICNP
jgi:hypothetical protein